MLKSRWDGGSTQLLYTSSLPFHDNDSTFFFCLSTLKYFTLKKEIKVRFLWDISDIYTTCEIFLVSS